MDKALSNASSPRTSSGVAHQGVRTDSFDLIIVGLGAVGSAAAWRAAAAGHRVLAFDRWAPPHTLGSTHGESRVTRESAWEGAHYVPLVRRANALWAELEQARGARFFERCGGLFIARPDDLIVAGSRASADAGNVAYELLDAPAIRRRWPHVAVPDGLVGFFEPTAGILHPEAILRAEHGVARAHGAELRTDEPVTAWRVEGDGVVVATARGDHHAARLILCTGAWMPELLEPLGVAMRVERTVQHWFTAGPGAPALGAAGAPVLLACEDGERATAVFPAMNGCVKVATHHSGEFVDTEQVERRVSAAEIAEAAAMAQRTVPEGIGAHQRSAVCLYTVSPHGEFIIDRHPAHEQVVLVSACSGFGFKFSAATGEMAVELAMTGASAHWNAKWQLPARMR